MAAPVVHQYTTSLRWTGNLGTGTSSYRAYGRDHEVSGPGKAAISGSADPAFRGDPARWNPEELLLSAAAQCHLLWYLHLASEAGVVVTDYTDQPVGFFEGTSDGVGQFRRIVLHPVVTVAEAAMSEEAGRLHDQVGERCAIARTLACPVAHEAVVRVAVPGDPAGRA